MRQSKWRQLSLHFQSPTVQCPWVLTSDSILLHYCKHELDTDWFLKWMCYNSTIAAGQWIKTTHILVTLSLEWLNSYKEDISWSRFCIDISMHPKLILIISEFPRWTKTTVYQQDRLSVVVNIEIDEICVKNMIVLKLQTRTRRSSRLPKGAKHLLGQKQTPADLHFTTNKAKTLHSSCQKRLSEQ